VQWTGDQFGLQGLFDMGGGHLPPYLCSGLVLNLTSTTIFGQWTGDQFGLQGLFDMGGGHLPPYLCSGLVINLTCKTCSMSVVDCDQSVRYGWWTSTTIFGQWTGGQFGFVQSTALEQDLFDMGGGHLPPYLCSGLVVNLAARPVHMGGGHLPPYLCSGLVINLACKACSIWVVDIYHHICAVDWCSI
jgi:hypothetical protein